MKVRELMELLEGYDPDMEVKIAYQPNFPMQVDIDAVAEAEGKVYVCQLFNGNDYAPHGLYED